MADQSHAVPIAVALIGAMATIGAALIATQPWKSDDSGGPTATIPTTPVADVTLPELDDFRQPASVFLSRDSGPGETTVNVSGEGYSSNERVVIRFHTEQIATTQANDQGSFSNVAVAIPTSFSDFAPQQFDIIASGERSLKSARAPFTLTG